MIKFIILISRQGKKRFTRFYNKTTSETKSSIINEVINEVLSRPLNLSFILETSSSKIIYKRYASLYFVFGVDDDENELMILELIHRLVEILDLYFGNVCELDLIFNFHKIYLILDELIIDGEICETSKQKCVKTVTNQEQIIIDSTSLSISSSKNSLDFNLNRVKTL